MQQEFGEHESCAICGKAADGDRWFCHFYEEKGRVTLCSPGCAELFLHRPVGETNGNGWGTSDASNSWDRAEVTRIVM
jgi:hypothetical protein